MSFISQLLSQPERNWYGLSPATEAEIEELKNKVEIDLPQEFLDL